MGPEGIWSSFLPTAQLRCQGSASEIIKVWGTHSPNVILGWPKSLFRFFQWILQKNLNELLANPILGSFWLSFTILLSPSSASPWLPCLQIPNIYLSIFDHTKGNIPTTFGEKCTLYQAIPSPFSPGSLPQILYGSFIWT